MRRSPFTHAHGLLTLALLAGPGSGAASGTDLSITGDVEIVIGPAESVAAGAGVEVDGEALPAPFVRLSGLEPGYHSLRFLRLPNWIEPLDQDFLIVGGATQSLVFDYKPLPGYYFLAIPPQRARSDALLRFAVRSSDPGDPASPAPGARLDMTVAPQPAGALSFDPTSGEFRYQVDPQDRRDFTVTFSGTGPSGPVSGTMVITPAPALPPEEASLHFDRPLPDPYSKDYVQIRESRRPDPVTFNWQQNVNPRSVSVSGRILLFEAGSQKSDLHARFGGDTDVEELKLYAETVTIRSPLRLPAAHVEIHARELRFEGDGSLDVTPLDNPESNPDPDGLSPDDTDAAGNLLTHGANGADGLAAPSIDIYVERFHSDPDPQSPGVSPTRFILNGARAQDGGNGRNGRDILGDTTNRFCGTYQSSPIIYSVCKAADGTIDDECGSPAIYGESGLSSGLPGKGGAGGDFTSPWPREEIASLLEQHGGLHGRPGINVTGGLAAGRFAIVTMTTPPGSVDCTSVHGTFVNCSRGASGTAPTQPCVCYPTAPTSGAPCNCISPSQQTCDAIADAAIANCPGDCLELENPRAAAACVRACTKLANEARAQCLLEHPDGKLCDDIPTELQCANGKTGWILQSLDHGAWLHPLIVRSMLLFAKDAYLNERIPEARALLEEYRLLILAVKGGLPPGDESDEFLQLAVEIETLLNRIDSNLDYFGNPETWVPMLSFEANLSAFREEVDRAIPILYLSHWVQVAAEKAEGTRDAAVAAKGQLSAEIEAMVVDHAIAEDELPALMAEAQSLAASVQASTTNLAALEAQLEKRAQENVEDRHNLPLWKKGIGILGAVAKMVPVYQPVLGYVGAGLTVISQLDTSHPLANLQKDVDLFQAIGKNPYAACANEKAKESTKDPKADDKNALKARLEACKTLVTAGVNEIRGILKDVQADKTEVGAELEKLRASDPIFTEATNELLALNVAKQQAAERVSATLDKINKFSSAVQEDELAIRRLDQNLTSALDVIDHSAIAYVTDMGRRTTDRLLNYQYLMAKAYQYRTLKSYTGNLQLGRMLDKIRDLVEFQASVPVLTPDQFDSLKAIYLEELGRIGQDILSDYNLNRPERSEPVSFRLTAEELAALNERGFIELDLSKKGLFGVGQEDLRIASIQTQDLAVTQIGNIGTTATMRLKLEHSGFSRISKEGETYLFTHYRTERVNPITWSTVYDGISRTWTESEISAAADSLLRVILNLSGADDILLYSRPAAMATLVLSKEVTADSDVDLRVDGLTLKLQYDYSATNSSRRQLMVDVSDELGPRVLLDHEDSNGRQDGLGSFSRSFAGPGVVRLEAPPSHGAWTFDHWEIDAGQGGGGAEASPIIDVTLGASRTTARAVYHTGSAPGELFRRGDTDANGRLNISDPVQLLSYLFLGGADLACKDAADANDDGVLNITDALVSLGYQFLGTAPPPAPGPTVCGIDPSEDALGPCDYAACP